MIGKMIERFRDLQTEIRIAVENDDIEKVRNLDQKLIERWEQIVAFSPNSNAEVIKMAEFLLEILTQNLDQTKGELAAKDKIIDLFKSS